MATPTEKLEELADRVARLPGEIADLMSMRSERPTPPADTSTLAPPQGFAEQLADAGPTPPPGGIGPGEPALPPPAAYESHGASQGPPPAAYADAAATTPPPPPDDIGPPQAAGQGGGQDNGEVVALLAQMLQALRGGNQRQVGRPTPGPATIGWDATEETYREGFSGPSAPSVDVSNIAGAGGASSFRGFGSNVHSTRYWQPDTTHVPR